MFIADHYARNRERYGKTLIFADRWFQCEAIGEYLEKRGIRAGTIIYEMLQDREHRMNAISENLMKMQRSLKLFEKMSLMFSSMFACLLREQMYLM